MLLRRDDGHAPNLSTFTGTEHPKAAYHQNLPRLWQGYRHARLAGLLLLLPSKRRRAYGREHRNRHSASPELQCAGREWLAHRRLSSIQLLHHGRHSSHIRSR